MKHNGAWTTLIQEHDGYCTVSVPTKYVSGRKFWIAKIIGTDKKYGLAREFVGGAYCAKRLEQGVYDVYNCPRAGAADYERYFLRVYPTGEAREITRQEVQEYIEAPEKNNTPAVLTEAIPF
jgi:hypothetical protein